MNTNGSGTTRPTHNPAPDLDAAWSPDGMKIVFKSKRDGNEEPYVMNADGTGVKRLTHNLEVDDLRAWQPLPRSG